MARATPGGGLVCECGPIANRVGGTRWPSPDEVAQRVRGGLMRLTPPPDLITLSGHGEPTSHPRFGVVVDRVLAARDALAPAVRVSVLTNGLTADQPSIRDALRRVDAVQLHSPAGEVPGERLEEMARALRDALPGVIVEVL